MPAQVLSLEDVLVVIDVSVELSRVGLFPVQASMAQAAWQGEETSDL